MQFLPIRTATAALLALLAACATAPVSTVPFDRRPVPAAETGSALPEGWQHGVFMQINVRAWRDSDGDGIGDLRGLTQSLDDLKALGIKGLWLMPITRSADHDHGHAVTDYRGIEPAYGTLADFDELLAQAHARGIGVIIDYVMNHSAASHPAFVQSQASKDSPLRDWYLWRDDKPEGWTVRGGNPWHPAAGGYFYATFGPLVPDFNLRNPAVIAYHQDNLRFWLNRGVDGFRFGAVTHLVENGAEQSEDQPQSHALMQQMQQLVASYPRRYLVCEATRSWARWASPQSCGSAFAVDLPALAASAARGDASAIQGLAAYFSSQPPTMATMLSNHDAFTGKRLSDQLKGDTAAYRVAVASYLLMPGTPLIPDGEEIGLAGAASQGAAGQMPPPMSKAASKTETAAQAGTQSLPAFYKSLLALRNNLAPLAIGSYQSPQVEGRVLAFQRQLGDERVLVLINYGRDPATLRVTGLPANAVLSNEYPAGAAPSQVDAGGAIHFGLAGQSLRVLRLVTQQR
jgi:alpha-amylase